MRSTVWNAVAGTLLLGCLSLVSLRDMTDNQSQKTNTFVSQDGIIALHLEGSEASDAVALLDTKLRVMSIYHVERQSGEVHLKSVRNVTWDLQLDEYNGVSPSPKEIKSLVVPR